MVNPAPHVFRLTLIRHLAQGVLQLHHERTQRGLRPSDITNLQAEYVLEDVYRLSGHPAGEASPVQGVASAQRLDYLRNGTLPDFEALRDLSPPPVEIRTISSAESSRFVLTA